MARYIDADKAVGIGYLSDWYQSSIDDTKPPIWTDEHLEELTNDFIVIPKDTPTADVVEVKHGCWKPIPHSTGRNGTPYECSICERTAGRKYEYCHCGAKMDGRSEQDER